MINNQTIIPVDDEILNSSNASDSLNANITTHNPKNKEQFTALTFDFISGVFCSLKSNINDYDAIMADDNLSAFEKAIAKRKLLAVDIGIGAGTIAGGVIIVHVLGKIFDQKSNH